MKKMLKSKKGFSLIELLIVMAILAIIAAIAINLFGGLLGNTRQKADQQTAKTLKKAITAYIAASGDKGLYKGETAQELGINDLIADLQGTIVIEATDVAVTGHGAQPGTYGPYLENPIAPTPGVATNYAPKWTSEYAPAGEAYQGWTVTIYAKSGNVSVEPSTGVSGDVVINTAN